MKLLIGAFKIDLILLIEVILKIFKLKFASFSLIPLFLQPEKKYVKTKPN